MLGHNNYLKSKWYNVVKAHRIKPEQHVGTADGLIFMAELELDSESESESTWRASSSVNLHEGILALRMTRLPKRKMKLFTVSLQASSLGFAQNPPLQKKRLNVQPTTHNLEGRNK